MKAVVREKRWDESEDGVAALRIAAYPQFPNVREREFFDSIYDWYLTHPLADQIKRWVAETEDGETVGHLAALPQYYRVGGQRVVAHTPADYMVLNDYGFQALSLMRNFFRHAENCVACDMVPAVISVETRLGAEVAGQMQYAAKLLNVSQLPAPAVPERLRKSLGLPAYFSPARGYTGHDTTDDVAGEPVLVTRPRAPIPKPLAKLINHGLSSLDEALGRRYGGEVEVEKLDGFDESFDELFEKLAAVVPCVPEKDAAFLRWRYGPGSPQHPVTVLGVKDRHGALLGYTVLKTSTKSPEGFIVDLTTVPGHRKAARALLRGAVRHFRREGAQIVRYRFAESPASAGPGDLGRLGFFYRKGRSNNLLVKFSDSGLHETGRYLSNWAYNVGDGEATFWLR